MLFTEICCEPGGRTVNQKQNQPSDHRLRPVHRSTFTDLWPDVLIRWAEIRLLRVSVCLQFLAALKATYRIQRISSLRMVGVEYRLHNIRNESDCGSIFLIGFSSAESYSVIPYYLHNPFFFVVEVRLVIKFLSTNNVMRAVVTVDIINHKFFHVSCGLTVDFPRAPRKRWQFCQTLRPWFKLLTEVIESGSFGFILITYNEIRINLRRLLSARNRAILGDWESIGQAALQLAFYSFYYQNADSSNDRSIERSVSIK